jgi:hypothetical protein
MYALMSTQVEARKCKVHGNQAGLNGALFATDASNLRISQCSLINNTSTQGAAITCAVSSKVNGVENTLSDVMHDIDCKCC